MDRREDQWRLPLWMYAPAGVIAATVAWHTGWALGWLIHHVGPVLVALF